MRRAFDFGSRQLSAPAVFRIVARSLDTSGETPPGIECSPDGWPVGGMRKPLIPRLDEVLSTYRVGIEKRAWHLSCDQEAVAARNVLPCRRYQSSFDQCIGDVPTINHALAVAPRQW